MRRSARAVGFALALAAVPLTAPAQTQHSFPQGFVPLDRLPGVDGRIRTLTFPSTNNAVSADTPIGFPYDFLGAAVTVFVVSTNGWVGFIPNTRDSSINREIGNSLMPNGIIAPWWDDLNLASATLSARYALLGSGGSQVLVIQVDNFSAAPLINDGGRWQVWLYQTPFGRMSRFDVRVEGSLGNAYSATSGYEGITGQPAGAFLPCANAANCSAADFAALVGRVNTVLDVPGPELTGTLLDVPSGARPGETALVRVALRNLGVSAANNVTARLYLSEDTTLDPGDRAVGDVTHPLLPANNAAVTRTATITIPAGIAPAEYFVFLELDPARTVPQTFDFDDVVLASTQIATAVDLEVARIDTPPSVNPGDSSSVELLLTQRGALFDGQTTVEVYASRDRSLDSRDLRLGSALVDLSGVQTATVVVSLAMPAGISPGDYFAVAVVDRAATVTELNEFNNTRSSPTPFSTGPDFAVFNVTPPASAPPGTTVDVTSALLSRGVPFTGAMRYRLFASFDEVISPGDVDLGTASADFTGEARLDHVAQVTIPQQIAPGRYRILVRADDADDWRETDESNNDGGALQPVLTHSDLRSSNVVVLPSRVQTGGNITVTAELSASGPDVAGPVVYRVFLSTDALLDGGDLMLAEGQVAPSSGQTAAISEAITLPPEAGVRNFRVLVVADPQGAITEADETNNVAPSINLLEIVGPDLTVGEAEGPRIGFFGRNYRVRGTIVNIGRAPAPSFRYAVYLSDNRTIGFSDTRLFLSDAISLPAGGRLPFDLDLALPQTGPVSGYWIGVLVDVFSQVPETTEANNTRALAHPIDLVAPAPDLIGTFVNAPTVVGAGETVGLGRLIENVGIEDAAAFDYQLVISDDPLIDLADTPISTGRLSLAQGRDDFDVDSAQLSADLAPGQYWFGLILDTAGEITEGDEENNAVLGPAVEVFAPAVRFVNASLPDATVGVPYEVGVFVQGSALPRVLRQVGGALPDGLSIDLDSGFITGTASREEVTEIVLEAELSGGRPVRKRFALRAAPPQARLTITTSTLPAAVALAEYTVELNADGGIPPYEWTTTSSLPRGLELDPLGALRGRPLLIGDYPIELAVRDQRGTSARARAILYVINAIQSVRIAPLELPGGEVDKPYCDDGRVELRADRGVLPYRWSLVTGQVPGLTLTETGVLCGTPSTPGAYRLLVRVTDRAGVTDSANMYIDVAPGDAFNVKTFTLPRAIIDTPYQAQIESVRGAAPYIAERIDGDTPPGISVAINGAISGTATSTGSYAFVVRVTDSRQRTRIRALSIVVDAPARAPEGCTCNATPRRASWVWVGALLWPLLIRRRK